MAWEHLDLSKPHLVYVVLGGFTSIFMLISSVIKEKLYIGEATVATLVGIMFGPHAANVIDPQSWGNVDQITLEFSRIVLVVQCFAVGVELPKRYMNRHWKSVSLLLIPVMGTGWIVTTLVIWWMFHERLDFIASLCVAACVTATDPVLASSVVGKGKFAKRVPKHLRDLLSAESGCNDGMAFPFIYLALYLLHYHSDAKETTFHWIIYTVLYECVFGSVYGVLVGYAARKAIKYAHENDFIDRESFLVFYFVLALFCAGSGSILGLDDLLVGFACGVGFSNDGWFQEKTEESHVSNVIDLLINLAFFVYFGTIIPWEQYNNPEIGTDAWRLVVVGLFVVLFRRIPIMLLLKPVIGDVHTWREALFAGHFGPIGVGAIFVAILARAELETGDTVPLSVIPTEGEFVDIIRLVWPITTFLVIVSIVVHGSSIAVFTLGRHINTLTLTFSFTNFEEGPSWMDRLPRMSASRSRTTMSRADSEKDLYPEKTLSPSMVPKNFLKRKKEEKSKAKNWDIGIGPGGPISQSAIEPASQRASMQTTPSGTQTPKEEHSPGSLTPREEIYREGSNVIIEDQDGNVQQVIHAPRETKAEDQEIVEEERKHIREEKENIKEGKPQAQRRANNTPERPGSGTWWRNRMDSFRLPSAEPEQPKRSGPARAYTFGNTVIVEDEDGEVIKQYQLPTGKEGSAQPTESKSNMLGLMGQYFGAGAPGSSRRPRAASITPAPDEVDERTQTDDEGGGDKIRFTIADGGPRLNKSEFINELQKIDSRARFRVADHLQEMEQAIRRQSAPAIREDNEAGDDLSPLQPTESVPHHALADTMAKLGLSGGKETAAESRRRQFTRRSTWASTDSNPSTPAVTVTKPSGPVRRGSNAQDDASKTQGGRQSSLEEEETPAERRRRQAALGVKSDSSKSRDGPQSSPEEEETPAERRRRQVASGSGQSDASRSRAAPQSSLETEETEAERRRRQAALGLGKSEADDSDDSDDDGTGFRDPSRSRKRSTRPKTQKVPIPQSIPEEVPEPPTRPAPAASNSSNQRRLRWGDDVGKKP